MFVKLAVYHPYGHYPDRHCNLEVYYDHSCTELETLAPLHHLEPGATVIHDEIWQVLPWSTTIDQHDLFKALTKVAAELV
jgi:hypothetical protein